MTEEEKFEQRRKEFREEWERDRPAREARAKRFFDWALNNDPELPDEAWIRALQEQNVN